MSRFIWGLTALILMGCPNGNPHTDDTDTGSDTDTDDPGQMAHLTVNVTLLGNPEPCFVRLNGEMEGPSGQELEVPAGSYTLTVGSDEMSEDGLPIHRDAENVPWVAPPTDIALVANGSKTESMALNRYFSAPFNCVENRYDYDASAPDLKGDLDDTYHWDEVVLTVENGREIPAADQMPVIGSNDALVVNGNSLVLETSDEKSLRDTIISVNEDGKTILSMTLVYEMAGAVSDVTCEEE